MCGLDDTAVLLCAFTEITQTAASTKNAFYSTPEGSVSPYGSRYGGENFYTGVDMAMDNAYGKSVLAAENGTGRNIRGGANRCIHGKDTDGLELSGAKFMI